MLAMGAALAVVFALSHAATFLWLLPLVMAYAFVSAPIIPLVDNSVLEMLGTQRAEYGKVRLWGSVGWGVVATLIGVAMGVTNNFLLHGPTFAAAWASGVAYVHDLAPEGMGATAQGLFNGMTMGLGAATGAFIGGLLYDGVGAAAMFMWVGIGLLVGALGFALTARTWDGTRREIMRLEIGAQARSRQSPISTCQPAGLDLASI
jgi:MFS family permease